MGLLGIFVECWEDLVVDVDDHFGLGFLHRTLLLFDRAFRGLIGVIGSLLIELVAACVEIEVLILFPFFLSVDGRRASAKGRFLWVLVSAMHF